MAYRLLFASRAYESSNTEGGFVHLKDIAARAAADEVFAPAFLSRARDEHVAGIAMAGGFSRIGWGTRASWQFVTGLAAMNTKVDLVHTAHVPTPLNSRILTRVSGAGRKKGVRYLQTVTALPSAGQLQPRLFWADAISCLNPTHTKIVSQFHRNVRTIAPVPAPDRLAGRTGMPGEFADQLASKTVICFPIEMSRLSKSFSLVDLCAGLLHRLENLHIVFACRFGEERNIQRSMRSLDPRSDRISVVGQIDWILDLIHHSQVVVYPVASLQKKFNPPLVVMEAACLSAAVVVSDNVDLSAVPQSSFVRQVAGDSSSLWLDAIVSALSARRTSDRLNVDFERSYQQYRDLYLELLEG